MYTKTQKLSLLKLREIVNVNIELSICCGRWPSRRCTGTHVYVFTPCFDYIKIILFISGYLSKKSKWPHNFVWFDVTLTVRNFFNSKAKGFSSNIWLFKLVGNWF